MSRSEPTSLPSEGVVERKASGIQQEQFLRVLSAEEAQRRFQEAVPHTPLGAESVPLAQAWQRVLAEDVQAPLDLPPFDRSNLDGFAVRAADTFGADEDRPRTLRLNEERLHAGVAPRTTVESGTATVIATGGVLPRGADAIVKIEDTRPCLSSEEDPKADDPKVDDPKAVVVLRSVTPGSGVAHAASDIASGETVLRLGTFLRARETGVLAALGITNLRVWRQPRVTVLSSGDELRPPGEPLDLGQIHDANSTLLADSAREAGAQVTQRGIIADDAPRLAAVLEQALDASDLVLLSGGTSKGAGDLNYRVVELLGVRHASPGILVHGVALKPGKPLCLAVVKETPLIILPGFPSSALFTYHGFVAPLLRAWGGLKTPAEERITARLPLRLHAERGRTEYNLVHLSPAAEANALPAAYPLGKGSGSVSAFARADGFLTIPQETDQLEEGSSVAITLLRSNLSRADQADLLVVIGSHCSGLDRLLSLLAAEGWQSQYLATGSQGGLLAARRGECDIAAMHLYDPQTNAYNTPFLDASLCLIPGYGRLQGFVFRREDARFRFAEPRDGACDLQALRTRVLEDARCLMINRNRGSGTRMLLDAFLEGAEPPGYTLEARSHHGVISAVTQKRADWGLAIAPLAKAAGLGFIPLREEQYDFVVPRARLHRPAVRAFRRLLRTDLAHNTLRGQGFDRERQRDGNA